MPSTPPPGPAPRDAPSVGISSLGRVDDIIPSQIGRVRARQPWVTGEELGTGFGVFLGAWQGRLEVSAAFNDAWHNEDEVRGFLDRVQGVVRRGVGLDEE